MRLVRLVGLLALVCSVFTGPICLESLVAPASAGPQASPLAIGAPRQSLPAPVHDEATCAFCQAALFPPCVAHAPAVLPELAARVSRIALSPDERILHLVSNRPVSSRAPPASPLT